MWLTFVLALPSIAFAQSSPDGASTPPLPAIVDSVLATWTIGSQGEILRNGAHLAGGWGSQILWLGGAIYVAGTDSNWWRWSGSSWVMFGPDAPVASSDCAATWTIGGDQAIRRNGAPTGGLGSQIVCAQNAIYALGTDNSWWRWTGSSWSPFGSTVPAGASWLVPSGECDATWTIESGLVIRRNGANTAGFGSHIACAASIVYVLGTDNNWWRWTGSSWSLFGPTAPSGAVTLAATGSSPPVGEATGECAASWTIASGQVILRNGVATGGFGPQLVCAAGTVYAFGTDGNWWRWTGSSWSLFGPAMPSGAVTLAGSSSSPPATGECAASWTIGSGQVILRNGAGTGGFGPMLVCAASVVYAFGTDSNWWKWTGSSWSLFGPTMPAGAITLATASGVPPGSGSTTRLLVFTPSTDHDTNVDSYELELLSAGTVQTSVARVSIGKPPVINGECSVDISDLLSHTPHAFDAYVAVLTAVGRTGRSAPAVSPPFTW